MSAITINFTDEELATLLVVADQQNIGLEDFIKLRCLRDLSDFQFEDQLLNEEVSNIVNNQPTAQELNGHTDPSTGNYVSRPGAVKQVAPQDETDSHLVEGDAFTKPIGASPDAKPAAPRGAPLYNKRITGNKWL